MNPKFGTFEKSFFDSCNKFLGEGDLVKPNELQYKPLVFLKINLVPGKYPSTLTSYIRTFYKTKYNNNYLKKKQIVNKTSLNKT